MQPSGYLVSGQQTENLKSVVLNDEHIKLGGRMVPFSGYSLPVQYPAGIIAEHKWTREHAGLFDVSHMGPSLLVLNDKSGDAQKDHEAIAALVEPLVTGDIRGLKPSQMRYTLLVNDQGGTLDDLMIERPESSGWGGALYIIVNAGTKEADWERIRAATAGRATLHRADDGGLLALQGPEAIAVAESLIPGIGALGFMTGGSFKWDGTDLIVTRSGYTGEDGFEILVDAKSAPKLWNALLTDARVKPIGLGARDSLRLEAGLPLYGHDLDETVSPTEAGLNFADQQAPSRGRRFPRRRPHSQRIRRRSEPHPRRPPGRRRSGPRRRRDPRCLRQVRRPDHLRRFLADPQPRHRLRLRSARAFGARHRTRRRGPRPPPEGDRHFASLCSPPLCPEGRPMTLRYTEDHEYIRLEGTTGTVGITNYAQDQLGDIVFVELPTVGQKLKKGDEAAVVESVKAASEIYSPASGTVTEVNAALTGDPGLINTAADSGGWIYKLKLDNPGEIDALMDDDAYAKHTA